jgi:hypothetical protein
MTNTHKELGADVLAFVNGHASAAPTAAREGATA